MNDVIIQKHVTSLPLGWIHDSRGHLYEMYCQNTRRDFWSGKVDWKKH